MAEGLAQHWDLYSPAWNTEHRASEGHELGGPSQDSSCLPGSAGVTPLPPRNASLPSSQSDCLQLGPQNTIFFSPSAPIFIKLMTSFAHEALAVHVGCEFHSTRSSCSCGCDSSAASPLQLWIFNDNFPSSPFSKLLLIFVVLETKRRCSGAPLKVQEPGLVSWQLKKFRGWEEGEVFTAPF